ncbi:hypothetical protein GDO78_016784 [Eleutherodactylus coqui]|uniref:Uncharacterized protein n=1 Tax=Eleutherodactylus coqui TaxID=57060 RepID=A0A8J6EAD6_ELECQ|nr:hypothetical protein GDO78_016784 [Eleutherodactylus coqui]
MQSSRRPVTVGSCKRALKENKINKTRSKLPKIQSKYNSYFCNFLAPNCCYHGILSLRSSECSGMVDPVEPLEVAAINLRISIWTPASPIITTWLHISSAENLQRCD